MLQILATLIIGGLVFGVTWFLYWYVTKARRIIQMTDHLQAPARHFLWGSMHLHPGMSDKRLAWLRGMNAKFGNIYKIWKGPFMPYVVICHPELAKDILRTAEPKDMSIFDYGMIKKYFGNGLLVSDGKFWQRNRHFLNPAFHVNMLKKYIDVMNKTTDDFIRVIEARSVSDKSFDICDPVGVFAFDTVLKCVVTFTGNIQGVKNAIHNRIIQITNEFTGLIYSRLSAPYLWLDILYDFSPQGRRFRRLSAEYRKYIKSIINQRKDELKHSSEDDDVRDVMDIMLLARDDDGKGMSDQQIEAEVKTMVAAGHDTTSSALSWILYALAKHPEHQDLCRKEVREILEGRETDQITQSDLHKLGYLNMVIKEALRLYSTGIVISRNLTQDLSVGEHVIPKGCNVTIALDAIHHNPEVWVDPDTFDPTRFLPENMAGHGAYDFIPFSAGPRKCMGQHFAMNMLKITVARIIQRYEIGYDVDRPVVFRPEIVLRAEHGLWLSFKRLLK